MIHPVSKFIFLQKSVFGRGSLEALDDVRGTPEKNVVHPLCRGARQKAPIKPRFESLALTTPYAKNLNL